MMFVPWYNWCCGTNLAGLWYPDITVICFLEIDSIVIYDTALLWNATESNVITEGKYKDRSPAKPNTSRQVIISIIWFWNSLLSIIKRQLPYIMYLQFVMNICSEVKFSFVFSNFLRWTSIQTHIFQSTLDASL